MYICVYYVYRTDVYSMYVCIYMYIYVWQARPTVSERRPPLWSAQCTIIIIISSSSSSSSSMIITQWQELLSNPSFGALGAYLPVDVFLPSYVVFVHRHWY